MSEEEYVCEEFGETLDWDAGEDGPWLCHVCADIADDLFKKRCGHSIDEELVRGTRERQP